MKFHVIKSDCAGFKEKAYWEFESERHDRMHYLTPLPVTHFSAHKTRCRPPAIRGSSTQAGGQTRDSQTTGLPGLLSISPLSAGISAEFIDFIRQGARTIPPKNLERLARKGYFVVLCRKIVDAYPELKHQHPRGYPQGATYENVCGAFLRENGRKVIVVAETFKPYYPDFAERLLLSWRQSKTVRPDKVLRHEVAHAHCSDRKLADNYALQQAYYEDRQKMPPEMAGKFAYCLTDIEEVLAEGTAILWERAEDKQNQAFKQAFPRSMDALFLTIHR